MCKNNIKVCDFTNYLSLCHILVNETLDKGPICFANNLRLHGIFEIFQVFQLFQFDHVHNVVFHLTIYTILCLTYHVHSIVFDLPCTQCCV